MRLAILAGATMSSLLLSACVVHVNDDRPRRVGRDVSISIRTQPLEAVRAARVEDGRFFVRVNSNGCTDASDFDVHVEVSDDGAVGLGVQRTDADLCKALVPDGVELSWSLADLEVTAPGPFRLLNPLAL